MPHTQNILLVYNRVMYMIKKNDVLIFGNYLRKGDDYALMLAREDEVTSSKLPMVSVINLNTNLPLLPENFLRQNTFNRRACS